MRYTEVRPTLSFIMLTVLLLFLGSVSAAAAPPTPGEPAPPFRFVGAEGLTYASADFFLSKKGAEATGGAAGGVAPGEAPDRRGRAVVIAWFPKAFTPG